MNEDRRRGGFRLPGDRHAGLKDCGTNENLVFDELLVDRKYQFLYVFVPVPNQRRHGVARLPDRDHLTA